MKLKLIFILLFLNGQVKALDYTLDECKGWSIMALDEKFAKWKGVPREKIDWTPRVDTDK